MILFITQFTSDPKFALFRNPLTNAVQINLIPINCEISLLLICTQAGSSFLKEFPIAKVYDYKIGTITGGYDFYSLLLGKSSIWFTKRTLFQDIIYYFNTLKCVVDYVI